MIHADCKRSAPWTMRRCLNKKIIKEEIFMQKLKKPVSILLVFMMIVSLFAMVPVTASAAVGEVVPENEFLTFTAVEANSSVTMNVLSGSNLQYNNNSGWQSYTAGTQITLADVGDSVRFCGKDTTFNWSNRVSLTGKVACSGNVMSLRLDGDGKVQGLTNNCFDSMFYGCTSLTQAPELPETELVDYCYNRMFYGCTNLTKAPELPATNLAQSCYERMFSGCTSLTKAPELPATNLADSCYSNMFYGCTSLTELPALPATTLASNCYSYMFSGCTSLTELPALPATTLANSCYSRMFYNCSKICISDEADTFGDITYSAEYRIPTTGEGTSATDALTNMFGNTGGKFTGTPDINTTYYVPAPAPATYTVTWKNWDGTELEKDENVAAGSTPSYDGADPTKPEDANNTYTFSGWTPDVVAATADATYTAQFDETPKQHQHDGITFDKWTSDNSLPTEAGNYYLGYDVTLTSTWTVSKNIRLCLNGNGITKNGGNVITIVGGGNLTIDDCGTKTHYFDVDNGKAVNVNTTPGENRQSFTGGYITGGTGQGYDGYFWS